MGEASVDGEGECDRLQLWAEVTSDDEWMVLGESKEGDTSLMSLM